MNVETIFPENEQHWLKLRTSDVTSTEVPALFGVSPYSTFFELWHRKTEKHLIKNEPNEWAKWGNRLQDAIAAGVAEDNGWVIRKMSEYMRDPIQRMGSSFDFAIGDEGLLEVKNVFGPKFRDEWLVEGSVIEAPPHIELQVQHQLAVSGRKYAYIAALISGNQVVLTKREPDVKIIEAIRDQISEFWETVDSKMEPSPNFYADADFISRLYNSSKAGKALDAIGNIHLKSLATQYSQLGDVERRAKESRESIKAEILTHITDNEKVRGDGFSILANMVKPVKIEYEREPYRQFRINWKKEKI